jgi:hypothetical protein
MRTCILCELEKLLSEFYQVKTDKSGYSGICIECKKEYNKNLYEKRDYYHARVNKLNGS